MTQDPTLPLDWPRWSRHANPDGTAGGWVRDDAKVAPRAFVAPGAHVFGPGTKLGPETKVLGDSRVGPHVRTRGAVTIDGSAVTGRAGLRGYLPGGRTVLERCAISDGAQVHASRVADAQVRGAVLSHSALADHAQAVGNRTVLENARVSGGGTVIDKPGTFSGKIADGRHSVLGSLSHRYVTEHRDGTVSPSVLHPAAFPDPELKGVTLVWYNPVHQPGTPIRDEFQSYVENLPDRQGGVFRPARELPAARPGKPFRCIFDDPEALRALEESDYGHPHGPHGHDHGHGFGHGHGHHHHH
ncbi:MAG: hypothetical protein PW734_02155 [Verrucomicrobium sp.]|nr:hypothetical protein [Verrucomicrobium sp.]